MKNRVPLWKPVFRIVLAGAVLISLFSSSKNQLYQHKLKNPPRFQVVDLFQTSNFKLIVIEGKPMQPTQNHNPIYAAPQTPPQDVEFTADQPEDGSTLDARVARTSKRTRNETDAIANTRPAKKRTVKKSGSSSPGDLEDQIDLVAAPVTKKRREISAEASLNRKRSIWTKKVLAAAQTANTSFQEITTPDDYQKNMQILFPLMLELGKKKGCGASLTTGPYAGANFAWLTAHVLHDWKLCFKILELFPEVDVDATPATAPLKDWSALATAVAQSEWNSVSRLIELRPMIDWNVYPSNHPSYSHNLLWLTAQKNGWWAIQTAARANPTLDWNITPKDGPNAGLTIVAMAADAQRWDVVNLLLDQNLPIDCNAAPLQGSGRVSAFWLACNYQQFGLVKQMMERDAICGYDISPVIGLATGATPLWYMTRDNRVDLALEILARHPGVNLNATPINHKYAGYTPLNNAIGNKQTGLAKLLVVLGAKGYMLGVDKTEGKEQDKLMQEIFSSIQATKVKIFELLYNLWNRSGVDRFEQIRQAKPILIETPIAAKRSEQELPVFFTGQQEIELFPELEGFAGVFEQTMDATPAPHSRVQEVKLDKIRRKLALQILLSDHPDIVLIPRLEDFMDSFVNLDEERNQKAQKNIATLAYREFRWENGVFDKMAPTDRNDIQNMMLYCLSKQQQKTGVQYSQGLRQKIIENIGREQEGVPRLCKPDIKKAIMDAISSHKNS